MSSPTKVFFTAREVADMLGISLRTLWRWTEVRILPPPIRFGRVVRWRASDLDRFVKGLESFPAKLPRVGEEE